MAKSAGARDVAPRIRAAFLQAVKDGRLHELMERSLEEDFRGTLNAVAKFCPKEIDITDDRKRSAEDYTDDELVAIVRKGSGDTSESTPSPGEIH